MAALDFDEIDRLSPLSTLNPQKAAMPLPFKVKGLSCIQFGAIYGTVHGTIRFQSVQKGVKKGKEVLNYPVILGKLANYANNIMCG